MGDAAEAAPPHHPTINGSAVVQAAPAWTSPVKHMRERDDRSLFESVGVCSLGHEIFGHRLKAIC
jgi:hypothetical protein